MSKMFTAVDSRESRIQKERRGRTNTIGANDSTVETILKAKRANVFLKGGVDACCIRDYSTRVIHKSSNELDFICKSNGFFFPL
jgi:hypothetical protein